MLPSESGHNTELLKLLHHSIVGRYDVVYIQHENVISDWDALKRRGDMTLTGPQSAANFSHVCTRLTHKSRSGSS